MDRARANNMAKKTLEIFDPNVLKQHPKTEPIVLMVRGTKKIIPLELSNNEIKKLINETRKSTRSKKVIVERVVEVVKSRMRESFDRMLHRISMLALMNGFTVDDFLAMSLAVAELTARMKLKKIMK